MNKIKNRTIGVVITLLIGLLLNYIFLPAITIRSIGFWIFLISIFIIGGFIQVIIDEINGDGTHLGLKICSISIIAGAIVIVLGGICSLPLFNSESYQKLTNIEYGKFEEDINTIENINNISIVDMKTAQNLGDRTIGSIKNSSWYEVDDEYNLIKYQNAQYRVSELNYGSFFKYLKAKNVGIPGYVLVNTENQEAKYVELNGNEIKYSESSYFSHDLRRHLRSQYKTYIFGKSFFEIDDDGKPYFITSVKRSKIGLFGGLKEESFIITNANTGESKEYLSNELPGWVDHAYDLEYLMNVSEYNLKYINGFWNSVFSRTGIVKTSYSYKDSIDGYDGYNTTLTANNEIVFCTGLTPYNNSESNVGFLLLNPRTGEIKRYDIAGAEEYSAMQSAESLVQDLKYSATFPTILNVNGNATYFMLLKDKAGLVQRYALCNIKNYSKVVQAESLADALRLYKEKINGQQDSSKSDKAEKNGKIKELYQAQIDGYTYYYFILENDDSLYMSSIINNYEQVKLNIGNEIKIEYDQNKTNNAYMVSKIELVNN